MSAWCYMVFIVPTFHTFHTFHIHPYSLLGREMGILGICHARSSLAEHAKRTGLIRSRGVWDTKMALGGDHHGKNLQINNNQHIISTFTLFHIHMIKMIKMIKSRSSTTSTTSTTIIPAWFWRLPVSPKVRTLVQDFEEVPQGLAALGPCVAPSL